MSSEFKEKKVPAAFKKLAPDVQGKAMAILKALLSKGMPEGMAIPIAIARAKKTSKEDAEREGVELDKLLDLLGDQMPDDSPKIEAVMSKKANSELSPVVVKVIEEVVDLNEGVKDFKLSETVGLLEDKDGKGTIWTVRCIQEGLSKNHTFYSKETLQESVHLFSGVPAYADHSDDYRSVRDVVGWFENPRYENDGVYAEFHALEATDWFLNPLREAYARGKTDLIGFSINGEGTRHADKVDGHLAYIVDAITVIESVDGVINPSAGGQIVKLVASEKGNREEVELMALKELTLEELKKAHPDMLDEIQKAAREEMASQLEALHDKEEDEAKKKKKKKKDEEDEAKAKEAVTALEEQTKKEEAAVTAKLSESEKQTAKLDETIAKMQEMQKDLEVQASQAKLRESLEGTGLPQVIRDKLLRQFAGRTITDDEFTRTVEDEETVLKGLQDERPESYPRIEMGEGQRDRAIKALYGLVIGEDQDGVPAARTMREAYAVYTNRPTWSDVNAQDVLREMWSPGLLEDSKKIREATGISSGTPAGFQQWNEVVADAIHKALLAIYAMPFLEDWRRIATNVIAVPDFKTQRRIRIGGYQNFISVAEAGTYLAVTTPTDEEATYSVTKYGGLESITLEAIANDDVGAIQRVPRQLARGAKTLLYETIFDLFRKNSNVTYEAVALVNSATHLNAINATTVDADLSDATLSKAKRLLTEQTEKDSSKPLGLRASLLVVPPELEATAMRLNQNEFAMSLLGPAESGTVTGRERDVNVHRGSVDTIVVPYWTDSASWFVVADPRTTPIIEVGFYQGKQEPELFVQDMPNIGTNFDKDVITYKSRLIFGTTVLDHRGVVGSSEEAR